MDPLERGGSKKIDYMEVNDMSKDNKRRDSKGRVLRSGEQQRQDGKFMYAYRGRDNKMHYVYSWKLEPTDKLPAGKRQCKALRQLEKEIEKSLNEESV